MPSPRLQESSEMPLASHGFQDTCLDYFGQFYVDLIGLTGGLISILDYLGVVYGGGLSLVQTALYSKIPLTGKDTGKISNY
jgi:hypothetical protein